MELQYQEDRPVTNIKVVGIGGGGGNAVGRMAGRGIPDVELIVMNTDIQALSRAPGTHKVQLGEKLTGGRGTGGDCEMGRRSAEESRDVIAAALRGAQMVFLTAGMGGGTGTGAIPVVAEIARELGILTLSVVTKPFHFEGRRRMAQAEAGLEALLETTDSLLVVPNQRLLTAYGGKIALASAFERIDEVVYEGTLRLASLANQTGFINIDFADIRQILRRSGLAHFAVATIRGAGHAREAAEAILHNPLMETGILGARRILLHVEVPPDAAFDDVEAAAAAINEAAHEEAEIIWGMSYSEELAGGMRVTALAAGFDATPGTDGLFSFFSMEETADSTEAAYDIELDELLDMVNRRRGLPDTPPSAPDSRESGPVETHPGYDPEDDDESFFDTLSLFNKAN